MQEMLKHYVEHWRDVVVRRTKYELKRAEDRAHILEGLRIAIDHLDRVIKIIRESKNTEAARNALMEKFDLSKIQAQAILDMRLHQLTAWERQSLEDEYKELIKTIARLGACWPTRRKILGVIGTRIDRGEGEIRGQAPHPDHRGGPGSGNRGSDRPRRRGGHVLPRRLCEAPAADTYRAQKRGGRGVTGMTTKEEDFVEQLFVTDTHAHLLLFTTRGRAYGVRVYEIPEAGGHPGARPWSIWWP